MPPEKDDGLTPPYWVKNLPEKDVVWNGEPKVEEPFDPDATQPAAPIKEEAQSSLATPQDDDEKSRPFTYAGATSGKYD